jgi:hypothetical protein
LVEDSYALAARSLTAFDAGDAELGRELLDHLAEDLGRVVRGRRRLRSCPYCEATYQWSEPLQLHIERAHPERINDAGGEPAERRTP